MTERRDGDAGPKAPPLDERHAHAIRYIREKTDELLKVIGTAPLRPEELDDETLIGLDPIGIVAGAFRQVLAHLKRTNEELKFAREELQAIFDCAGLGILVIDRGQRIVACNAKFREQFGMGDADLQGQSCREVVCKTDRPDRPCPFMHTLETGEAYRCPDWVVGERHYDIVETAVRNQEGEITGSVLVYSDITDRIAADEALRRSEERYRDLFENSSDVIFRARPDGTLEYVNEAWCATLGYVKEEVTGLNLLGLLHENCDSACRARLEALLRGEGGGHARVALRSKDGRMVVLQGDVSLVSEGGAVSGIRAILRDVTELEDREEEQRRREKLESVGLLAGGIAHDFNNILTGVLGNISLALAMAAPGDPVHARLAEAEKATLTARRLTQQLLTFSSGGSPVKRLTTIEQLLNDHAVFACRGSNVSCRIETDPGLWAVEVDEGQIGQVVHNLVLNAVQAMGSGGKVQIVAKNVTLSPLDEPARPGGRYLRIDVRDTGCGVPPENLQRMFDPYFTTKPGGSGLGLAVSYSIVKQHGGWIAVDSTPGEGTTFSVLLPASEQVPTPPEPPKLAPKSSKGRILVMDDEKIVREVVDYMLDQLGFEVETVEDGAAAIERYEGAREQGRPFDVVIMDLTIPGGMGGAEAMRELRGRDPGVAAIVSSGYSNDPVMSNYAEHGFCGVITKPFRLADLAAALKIAMGPSPASR